MKRLTGEQRYRQANAKDRIRGQRDMRLFMAGKIDVLPCSQLRAYIIAEFDRAYEAGRQSAREQP